jgi:hypothetical protein
MIALLMNREYLEEDFVAWHRSGKMMLLIKPSALELSVLCENEKGGLVLIF